MSGIISDNADVHSGLIKTPSANVDIVVSYLDQTR